MTGQAVQREHISLAFFVDTYGTVSSVNMCASFSIDMASVRYVRSSKSNLSVSIRTSRRNSREDVPA